MGLRRWLPLCALAGLLMLIGCEGTPPYVSSSNESNYLAARAALESGRYDVAITRYQRLLARLKGRPAARVRLEYSHALLRANRFSEAVATASPLAQSREASIAAAALAVRGTARHEQARARIADGASPSQTRKLLASARKDLTAFVRKYRRWDVAGSMQARLRLLKRDQAKL